MENDQNNGVDVNIKLSDLLKFQVCRKLTYLAKHTLITLEDLIDEGYKIPSYQRIRKKTLDLLSESKQEIEETFDKFDIKFK